MSPAPKVSVVIPNQNGLTPRDGLTYLEMVLPTLGEQGFRDFDVTVVDDGSTDDSVRYLKEHWPEVRVVALAGNSGFPKTVNAGIEASEGEYIALLNNDVELSPDWLERLAGMLDREPGLGFVTGKIVRYRERMVIEQAGQDLYSCGMFAPRGLDADDVGQYEEPRRIPIATAAASIYRREAVARANGFDEDYFLYCEDADLCLRMVLLGYHGLYVPGPVAYHVRGEPPGGSPIGPGSTCCGTRRSPCSRISRARSCGRRFRRSLPSRPISGGSRERGGSRGPCCGPTPRFSARSQERWASGGGCSGEGP